MAYDDNEIRKMQSRLARFEAENAELRDEVGELEDKLEALRAGDTDLTRVVDALREYLDFVDSPPRDMDDSMRDFVRKTLREQLENASISH
jgi:predicted RNase H-like nuclease (RuvC/YqgF family)